MLAVVSPLCPTRLTSQVSMKKLFAVNRRSTFSAVSFRRQPPWRGGSRGVWGRVAPSVRCSRQRAPNLYEPRSTYPFELRHVWDGRVPSCRIRAAAHVGSRRCRRARPRPTPTKLQTVGSVIADHFVFIMPCRGTTDRWLWRHGTVRGSDPTL